MIKYIFKFTEAIVVFSLVLNVIKLINFWVKSINACISNQNFKGSADVEAVIIAICILILKYL